MLGLRTLSSIIIILPVIAAIWLGGVAYSAMIVLVGAAIGWELARLANLRTTSHVVISVLLVAATPVIAQIQWVGFGGLWIITSVVGFLVLARADVTENAERIGFAILCCLAHLALYSLVWLRLSDPQGMGIILFIVLVIAATDIGGYFFGRFIGGPKLAVKISPNKTWAGLIGGMLFAGIVSYAVARGLIELGGWSVGDDVGVFLSMTVILGVVVAPIAQTGDLLESWIKRKRGVKDSSNLIPGHGGVLDRIDGYLTTVPLVALMALLDKGGPISWP